jgi:hypothetical protein
LREEHLGETGRRAGPNAALPRKQQQRIPGSGKQEAVAKVWSAGFVGAASRRRGRGSLLQRHVAGCPLAKASGRESIIVIYFDFCRWTVVSAESQ